MDLGLSGRVAIVTGGSRGIGKAIAGVLLGEGASVTVAARNPGPLSASVCDLSGQDRRAVIGIPCDTHAADDVDQMVSLTKERFGRIDVLINCAGKPGRLAPQPKLQQIDMDEAWSDFDTKVMGYLRCIRAVVPHMTEAGGGRIVNVSGLGARLTGATVRSMRNASVVALTKSLADELGGQGISLCAVHPGFVRTEATQEAVAARATRENSTVDEVEKVLGSGNALGRIVTAEEVAWVVAFLASPRAVAINGDVVAASGGARKWIHY